MEGCGLSGLQVARCDQHGPWSWKWILAGIRSFLQYPPRDLTRVGQHRQNFVAFSFKQIFAVAITHAGS